MVEGPKGELMALQSQADKQTSVCLGLVIFLLTRKFSQLEGNQVLLGEWS